MDQRIQVGGLDVAASLHRFVVEEALPGSGVDPRRVLGRGRCPGPRPRAPQPGAARPARRAAAAHRRLAPGAPGRAGRRGLPGLPPRDRLPARRARRTCRSPPTTWTTRWPPSPVRSWSCRCDNARFAANAVNARWGSLYDALYGTDVVPQEGDLAPGDGYNTVRGDEVIARGRAFLDEHLPLAGGSHADATAYAVDGEGLAVTIKDDVVRLADPDQLVGYRGAAEAPEGIVLVHHGLHVEIQVDREDTIGSTDAAGVKDLLLESAVSTIMDLEDSVAAVDADDKVGRLPQLAAADGGHAGPGGQQGRQDLHPGDEPRPDLHDPVGRRGHPPGPFAAVHPPGRPPDDHRRGARPQRRRGARGDPRRPDDGARQPA